MKVRCNNAASIFRVVHRKTTLNGKEKVFRPFFEAENIVLILNPEGSMGILA